MEQNINLIIKKILNLVGIGLIAINIPMTLFAWFLLKSYLHTNLLVFNRLMIEIIFIVMGLALLLISWISFRNVQSNKNNWIILTGFIVGVPTYLIIETKTINWLTGILIIISLGLIFYCFKE